ncbi:hypothetical protein V8E36_006153 [Tilletia maclaganii]
MRSLRGLAFGLLACSSALVPTAHAFNATARRANCTNADFDMEISAAEFRAANIFEVSITTPSGENRDGFFPLVGSDPDDPLFALPNNLSTGVTITWRRPFTSGGNSSWVFTLYNNSVPILYPGSTYIDTGIAYQFVDCDPPPDSTTTSTTDVIGTVTSTTGGAIASGTSGTGSVNPTASATSGNSDGGSGDEDDGGSGTNVGAIAGGVVGGVLGLALIAVLAVWLLRRPKHHPQQNANGLESGQKQPAESYYSGGGAGGPGAGGAAAVAGAGAGAAAAAYPQSPSSGYHSPSFGSDGRPLSAAPSAVYSTGGWAQINQRESYPQPMQQSYPNSHHQSFALPAGGAPHSAASIGGMGAGAGAAGAYGAATTQSSAQGHALTSPALNNPLLASLNASSSAAYNPSSPTASRPTTALHQHPQQYGTESVGGPGASAFSPPPYDASTAQHQVLSPEKAAHVQEHVAASGSGNSVGVQPASSAAAPGGTTS